MSLSNYIIRDARLINEGKQFEADVLVKNGRIAQIGGNIDVPHSCTEINAAGLLMIPGIIDDQVHFREPGLTHKANIFTESRAAVVGGVTSFMDMPNVKPPSLTQSLLEDRYRIAQRDSIANYSFYMGVSNENTEEVLETNPLNVCGVKIFMGSSTGNMLVDKKKVLEKVFSSVPMLIATHCEDEKTIRANLEQAQGRYGDNIPISMHPVIRNEECCYISSSYAVSLAKKHNSRLHVLHISTEDELALFDNSIPLKEKRITAEVCVHHLWFESQDYQRLGTGIKCNPAIKEGHHRKALLKGLLDDHLDIIATDHAPHTRDEKDNKYMKAPSGLPLVQHSLNMMMEFYQEGKISMEKIVEKMCHAPADCFQVKERGYIREGYWGDLVLIDPRKEWTVSERNILYKCGWSPMEAHRFTGRVTHTFISGKLAYEKGRLHEDVRGQRLYFDRA